MPPRKVLIVDDSKLLHRMFEMMLRQYPLVHAYDGKEALERLAENGDVDLVLLDMNMPEMSGEEALGHFTAIRPDVRVIVSSGHNESLAAVRFAGQRVAGFIPKPYTSRQLAEKINSILIGDR